MGTIFTTSRHTSGVARIHVLNNTNNNINVFRHNSRCENININEEIPPKYTELYNTNNINGRELRDYLVPDNGLPPY